MPTAKKRFFKRKEKVIGDNSGKPREKKAKKVDPSVRIPKPEKGSMQEEGYSPNIYRSIAERFIFLGKPSQHTSKNKFTLKNIAIACVAILFVGLLVIETYFLSIAGQKLANLLIKRHDLAQNMKLWEGIAQKYPTYRDAYFQAAILAYELGDTEKKQVYIQKVLLLDPNYEPAKRLENL